MLRILNIYWVFTLGYYCLGKIKWSIPSYFILVVYALLCYVCVNIGYYSVKAKNRNIDQDDKEYLKIDLFPKYRKIFRISCIMLIFFQISWVIVLMGRFNIFNIIQNLGSNYFDRLSVEIEGSNYIMQIRTLLWIFTYYVYPIGFSFFKEMGRFDKSLFSFSLLVDVFATLNLGISKNIGDIIIIFIAVMMLNTHSEIKSKQEKQKDRKKIIKIIISVLILFIVFSVIQDKRFEAVGKTPVAIKCDSKFGSVRENSIIDILCLGSPYLVYLVHSLCNYFSSAYTALALSFTLPFKTTYGLGFSRALMEYVNQYLHISVMNNTYCQQLEDVYGWLNGVSWPTAFVWIANAVSLIGVPFVMIVLGRIWCRAEVAWKSERRLIGLIVYCQLVIAFIFLPCNAQIVQSRSAFIATTVMFLLFAFRKWKVKIGSLIIQSRSYNDLLEKSN